ncbi:MAG: hypothetical protein MUF83_22635 [Acidimicrobiales bacterium]|nr:hypothetical protein [Acidimicrobiales bacterium]
MTSRSMRAWHGTTRGVRSGPQPEKVLLRGFVHFYGQKVVLLLGGVLPRSGGLVWIPGDCIGSVDRCWEDVKPAEEQAGAVEEVRRCRALAERIRVASVEQ